MSWPDPADPYQILGFVCFVATVAAGVWGLYELAWWWRHGRGRP